MNSGIYKILNTINGHQYVGSAINLKKRKNDHWKGLAEGKHRNSHLQRAWNKYGEAAFEFRVIGTCPPEKLVMLEQEVMDHLKPEYNIAPVAGSSLGIVRSEETRRKISKSKTNPSTETRLKMSMSGKNKPPISYETRHKLSIARKGNTNRLGTIHSKETKRKIGEAGRGRKRSEESKLKTSKSIKAWWDTRKGLSEENKR